MSDSYEESSPLLEHRAGFVSVVGKPNVGKSTLMNAYLGQKISIVSDKPQTTRRRVLGILTLECAQVIFVDTPGIHHPQHKLGEVMLKTAVQAIPDADVVLWVVDATHQPGAEDWQIADLIREGRVNVPVILGLNKADLVPQDQRASREAAYLELVRPHAHLFVSASDGENRSRLLDMLVGCLPPGPSFYPEDQITDQTERAIAAELIREQVLLRTRQEVPHAVDVVVEEFKLRSDDLVYVYATVIVEKSSQKGILLGRGGQMIRAISQAARVEIENLVGAKVYLELWVKVHPKWRDSDSELGYLGYRG